MNIQDSKKFIKTTKSKWPPIFEYLYSQKHSPSLRYQQDGRHQLGEIGL